MNSKGIFIIVIVAVVVGVVFMTIFDVFKSQSESMSHLAKMQSDLNKEQSSVYEKEGERFNLLNFLGI